VRSYRAYGKLLDIGCATGVFLQEGQKTFSVQGIDISPFAVEVAKSKGLDVECCDLENSTNISPPYDVISLFDTIEHLQHPANTLRKVSSLMENEGMLFITTGDTGSLFARISGKNWRLLTPPQHLWFFNRRNLSQLLDRAGFRVLRIFAAWRKVPVSLMWYQFFRGKVRPLAGILGKRVLPINLFDNMTVIATKKEGLIID
jgi:SAM-dependent methyltransferase